ncbi:MAG: hypothetical protein CL840_19790 [Crocinitomicaceae bacterium]|nr:hypothetical protein [Crocinitomicaceae bacterium]
MSWLRGVIIKSTMNIFPFNEPIKAQIKKVVNYSLENIYDIDDLLDMMNGHLEAPGSKPEHSIRINLGSWTCYYVVDHPEYGKCNYFQITPDLKGNFPDDSGLEYILSQFGIENPYLENQHKLIRKENELTLIMP